MTDTATAYPSLHLVIAGQRLDGAGRESLPVFNPATGEVLGNLPVATSGDLAEAVSAAAEGFERWRSVSALERSVVLRTAAKLIRERRDHLAGRRAQPIWAL